MRTVTLTLGTGDECTVELNDQGQPNRAWTAFSMASFNDALQTTYPAPSGYVWSFDTVTAQIVRHT